MTNVPPVSRKINSSSSGKVLKKVEDFNNIVVMSGTATRKSLEKKDDHSCKPAGVKPIKKSYFKDSLLKLRAPFHKSHHKQTHSEEKLMTKSCEILLGCIKPYKEIRVARKTKVTESITIGSILRTTNIIYERKATRKVQFFSFADEHPTSSFLFNTQNPSTGLFKTALREFEYEKPGIEDVKNCKIFDEIETSPNSTIKTVSSEDFITKVIPQGVTTTL